MMLWRCAHRGLAHHVRWVSRPTQAPTLGGSSVQFHWISVAVSSTLRDIQTEPVESYTTPHLRGDGRLEKWAILGAGVAALAGLRATALTDDTPESELQEASDVVSNEGTQKWRLFTDQARDLGQQQRYAEARTFLEAALAAAREGFGERDAHVAAALNNLAELHRVQHEYQLAEPYYLEAINILDEALGRQHPSTAVALHNMAGFHFQQRDYERAQVLYEEAAAAKAAALGQHHPEYATALFHLAEVLNSRERREDAVALLKQSLDILEAAGMSETSTSLQRWGRLAQMLVELSMFAEAESVQRRILQMVQNTWGERSLQAATAAENLAGTLEAAQRWEEAAELLRSALDLRRAADGHHPDSPAVGRTLRRMAVVEMQGGLGDGRGESEHKAYLKRANELAHVAVHIASNELSRALQVCQRAQTQAKASAPHPKLMTMAANAILENAHSLRVFATICQRQKKLKEAEQHLRRAIDILTVGPIAQSFKNTAPVKEESSKCMLQLAELMEEQGEDATAISQLRTRVFALGVEQHPKPA